MIGGYEFKLLKVRWFYVILATARQYQATVLTQNNDFEGLAGVEYFKK